MQAGELRLLSSTVMIIYEDYDDNLFLICEI